MSKYGFIYLIKNKINNKIYIGQTSQEGGFNKRYGYKGIGIERVFNCFIYKRDHNEYYNEYLLKEIEKYGFQAFEVIEEFDVAYSKEELDKLEYMYIEIYNSRDEKFGYNKEYGGTNNRKTEEHKIKIGKSNPSAKPVYCYEFEEIRLTVKQWAIELNMNVSSITNCCRGRRKSCRGYHFRYATENEIKEYKNSLK